MFMRPIYLDYQATTPLDERVLKVMLPFLQNKFGNPHSAEHAYGWEAEAAVKMARGSVAHVIGAAEDDIVFTSGATESNNMAIKGVAHFYKAQKNHIITSVIEHKCVLETCRFLESEGFKVTYLPVDRFGHINLEQLASSITDKTSLVSIMMANNEVGTIQPVDKIGEICRERGVFFHTDAAQAFGKVPIHVDQMNIDLLSISAHKIYGPKGVGALYIRKRPPVRLVPLIHGGGQEKGLRSGTLATHQVVGLGEAARLALMEQKGDAERIKALSHMFLSTLQKELPEIQLNGHSIERIPGNLNISFLGLKGESLILALKKLAISSGAACASASTEPSYVLQALGLPPDQVSASIRFSLGRMTTKEEVLKAAQEVIGAVKRLRSS